MHFESYSVHAFYVLHMYFFLEFGGNSPQKLQMFCGNLDNFVKVRLGWSIKYYHWTTSLLDFSWLGNVFLRSQKLYFSLYMSKIRTWLADQCHFCHHRLVLEKKLQKFYGESEKFNNLKFKNKSKQQSTKLDQSSFVDIETFNFEQEYERPKSVLLKWVCFMRAWIINQVTNNFAMLFFCPEFKLCVQGSKFYN